MLMFFTGFIVVGLFIFGSVIGSFLHVVAERYMAGESFLHGRSHCPHCGKVLSPGELIPIISYIYSHAKCRACSAEIPMHYSLVELASGLLAIFILAPALLGQTYSLAALATYGAACILLILIRIDYERMLLPDGFIFTLGFFSILAAFFIHRTVDDSILGALVGSIVLYIIWSVTGGEGIGFGDVKLMIPLGILFGLHGVISLLFFAFFIGGLYGISLLVLRRASRKTAIPFGPFLAYSAFGLMCMLNLSDRFFAFLGVY